MEQLHNGFTLEISQGSFPLSTDSVALSGFVRLPRNAAVLDLGAGCGTLGVLLCADCPDCHITGIELESAAHQTALKNAEANHIRHRLTSICADIRNIPEAIRPGSFDVCVSNPPYFSGGPKSRSVPTARHEETCSLAQLMAAAARHLKYGGDFFLVHRPERLAELCAQASAHQLEPKRLQLLRHRCDGPVALVLVQCRKGGKPGLSWEEVSLFDAEGQPTDHYKKLYHL